MKKNLFIACLLLLSGTIFAQTTVNAEEIIKKINSKQAVSYENAIIKGDLDLTTPINNKKPEKENYKNNETTNLHCLIEVAINFKNCTFKGQVIGYLPDEKTEEKNTIYAAQFTKGAAFNGCTFENDVNFKYTEFVGKGEFSNSKFKSMAFFKYSEFPTKAMFKSTEFSGETSFKYTEFKEGVSFVNSEFNKEVTFKYCEFSKVVDFSNTTFKKEAIFKYTEFPKGTNLSNVKFNGFADFKYAKIYRSDFEKASFNAGKDTKYISLK